MSRKTQNNAISTTRTLKVGRLTQASYRPLSTALGRRATRSITRRSPLLQRQRDRDHPRLSTSTSARLTTTTTEVSYRAQPGSPRRFPARPVLSLSLSLFFCRFRGPPDSRSRSPGESEAPEMHHEVPILFLHRGIADLDPTTPLRALVSLLQAAAPGASTFRVLIKQGLLTSSPQHVPR